MQQRQGEAAVEEEDNFGPQPLARLEVFYIIIEYVHL